MHLHWERNPNVAGDCNIRSLSWMGRVPDEIPQVSLTKCKHKLYTLRMSLARLQLTAELYFVFYV